VVEALGRSASVATPAPPSVRRVAVLGAGPVGLLLACECLAAGLEVRLHSTSGGELSALEAAGSVTVRGAHLVGSYRVSRSPHEQPHLRLAASVDDAVSGADVIWVATAAAAHATVAGLLAPVLAAGQTVVLVPGRFLGSVEFVAALERHLCTADVVVADLDASPYLASADGTRVMVHGVTGRVGLATLPVGGAGDVVERLAGVLPALTPVDGPLDTAFGTITGVLGVAPLVTNTGAVEHGKPGSVLLRSLVPHGLARTVLDSLDRERRSVGFHYGVRDLEQATTWLATAYGDGSEPDGDLADALEALEVFDEVTVAGHDGPLVSDDVAFTLVPLASAGEVAGVPTPATDAVVALASQLAGVHFRREGRTLDRLGLSGIHAGDLRRHLAERSSRRLEAMIWRRV